VTVSLAAPACIIEPAALISIAELLQERLQLHGVIPIEDGIVGLRGIAGAVEDGEEFAREGPKMTRRFGINSKALKLTPQLPSFR
jgi:hypothetical protein